MSIRSNNLQIKTSGIEVTFCGDKMSLLRYNDVTSISGGCENEFGERNGNA